MFKNRSQNPAGAHGHRIVHILLFKNHLETVSGLHPEEVDGVGIDFRQFHRHGRRNILLLQRSKKGTFNHGRHLTLPGNHRAFYGLDVQ